jgi:hypothetical protein
VADERANTRTNHLRDRDREQQAALRVFRRAQRRLTAAHEACVEVERAQKAAAEEQGVALAALARLVGDDQVTAAATDLDLTEVAAARKHTQPNHTQPTGPGTHPPARQGTRRSTATRSRATPTTAPPTTTAEPSAPTSATGGDPVTRSPAPTETDPGGSGPKRPG